MRFLDRFRRPFLLTPASVAREGLLAGQGVLRAVDVCLLANITYRQLDYWARMGYVSPTVPASGSGSKRLYSIADFRKVVRIATLLEATDVLSQALPQLISASGPLVKQRLRGKRSGLPRVSSLSSEADEAP